MGWWSDRVNSVRNAARAVSNTVSSARRAVVETVVETVEDVKDAIVEEVVETYEVATEAYDNAMASVTTAVSDAYEGSMVWVADNVFAEDTWVGQGMNWAADAGDKLSNMYDYMIENPERAFATIGEGLEEGVGYIIGTPGYLADLVVEGGDWAYSSMTGSERMDGFGLNWGNNIAGAVDKGFDHAQAGINYSIDHVVFGLDTTYAEALDEADVKVLNEEEALLKGITIGAMEVTLLAATMGGSGVARAGAWTARIAGKADDVVRLTNTGARISNATSRFGAAAVRTAETASRPFRAAASIPGVSPALKYAVVPGGLFFLNVNGELSAYRVQELQERTVEMQGRMLESSITGIQEREDYIQDLLSSQNEEMNAMVDELNSSPITAERRAEIVTRFEELEAQSDLIEEWQSPDTTDARRQEIFTYLHERNAEPANASDQPENTDNEAPNEFNTNAEGVEPVTQDGASTGRFIIPEVKSP